MRCADQCEGGGQDDERRRARQQGHRDPSEGEGAQEHERKDEQCADRRGHGEGAAGDGAAGMRQGFL